MKKALTITLLGIVVAAMAITNPILKWEKKEIDLGSIKKGELAELKFSFTNEGQEAVRILNAKGSCGCTDVTYSKEEIVPGETTEVSANFRSSKLGAFNKTVTVTTTGSDEPTVLKFKGTIVE